MRFVKMHGLGNDYVYLDAVSSPAHARRSDLSALARAVSDRHRGIGSDGLILVCRPAGASGRRAHIRMRMFNADGSESEMCGNGVRCVAKFAHDRLRIRDNPMRVQTGRGVLEIAYTTRRGRLTEATVDMGEPILDRKRLGFRKREAAWDDSLYVGLEAAGTCFAATLVSMGNPHAVVFQDPLNKQRDYDATSLHELDLARIGPALEHHRAFTNRANIHFVAVHSRREATMRTWERGSGITQACGTGACAVLVAGVLTQRLARRATLHLPGGDLRVHWNDVTNRVLMTGPATEVFEGEWKDR